MGELYIGAMSGTSMDAIDVALVSFERQQPQLLGALSHPIPATLRNRLSAFATPSDNELAQMMELDVVIGREFAHAVNTLLHDSAISPSAVCAIGSHGQTIRHLPLSPFPSTLQIGDANIIAQQCGITTVADFRRRDMAVGGQGAPLVPAFHAAILRSNKETRVVVNIGGMANISVLPGDAQAPVIGFDTGPGNVLMDGWIQRHQGLGWDEGGCWAAQGEVDQALLQQLLDEPYFHQPAPKSTGRELFNEAWLLSRLSGKEAARDVQATLCELTAISITLAVEASAADCRELLVCGGGAYNTHLMSRLAAHLPAVRVAPTTRYGVDPRWMEAMAFAWLARQTLLKLPGNLPEVTGAKCPVILGAIYQANS